MRKEKIISYDRLIDQNETGLDLIELLNMRKEKIMLYDRLRDQNETGSDLIELIGLDNLQTGPIVQLRNKLYKYIYI